MEYNQVDLWFLIRSKFVTSALFQGHFQNQVAGVEIAGLQESIVGSGHCNGGRIAITKDKTMGRPYLYGHIQPRSLILDDVFCTPKLYIHA
ncbi:hypothetical protein AKJ16_DCAP15736 [Drosera capensis]